MRKVGILLGLELRSLFGINKLRYTRDKQEKRRGRLTAGIWVFLLLVLTGCIVGQTLLLAMLDLGGAVPMYLCTIVSMVTLLFGIFKAGNALFGPSGYDLLVSMPLSPSAVIISRWIRLYVEDLLFSSLILVPGVVTYAVLYRPALGFYGVAAAAAFLVPLVPLSVAALFGTLITALSARMKHKHLIQAGLSVALVISVLFAQYGLMDISDGFSEEVMSDLLVRLFQQLGRLYPPAVWLSDAMLGGSMWGLGRFVLLSLGVAALAVMLAASLFSRIMQGLFSVRSKQDYKVGTMQADTLLLALYKREAKRYFASSIYVTNTIIGPILAAALSVGLCVAGVDTIASALPATIPVRALLPFALSAVLCMMPPACVAISMEGKQMDTIRSLPIPPRAWVDSKMLWSLSLLLPAWVVAEIALTIVLRPSFVGFAGQLLAPLSAALLSVALSLTVNLKFHSFDWEREEVPVKQSLPALLGGMAGPVVSLGACGVLCLVPASLREVAVLAVSAVFLGGAWLLCRRARRVRMETL